MDAEKLLIGLASVGAGWVLAQFTSVAKDLLYARKIRKAMLEELGELDDELDRTIMILSRQLQIYGLQGIDNGIAVPVSNHIFSNYYKDAVLSLNKQQRISYQLINTLLYSLNEDIAKQKQRTEAFQSRVMNEGKEALTKSDFQSWGEGVISLFHQAAVVQWHIRYHLSKPKSPELLPYTKQHETYLQFLESVDKKANEIIQKAESLEWESFEKVYNPEDFAKR